MKTDMSGYRPSGQPRKDVELAAERLSDARINSMCHISLQLCLPSCDDFPSLVELKLPPFFAN
jgi:hypothetical protein